MPPYVGTSPSSSEHDESSAPRPLPSAAPSPGGVPARRPSPYRDDASRVAPVLVDVTAPPRIRDGQIADAARTVCPDLFGPSTHGAPPAVGYEKSASSASISSVLSSSSSSSAVVTRSLSIEQLGGGLSNHLFVVSLDLSQCEDPGGAPSPTPVLVRVYGEGEDGGGGDGNGFVDREFENRVLAHLSVRGLAPTFHGRFLNGRVEEYYPNCRPLSWDEMSSPRYAGGVAAAMAALHRVRVPSDVLGTVRGAEGGGEIWDRIESWFGMARGGDGGGGVRGGDEKKDESDDGGGRLAALDVGGSMYREWEWLRSELRGRPPARGESNARSRAFLFSREVVFAHMDCQSLNILTPSPPTNDIDQEGGEAPVRLIDFEYAGLNPRAADIANTFCEHCNMNNLDPDYGAQYPTPREQDMFLRRYAREADPDLGRELDESRSWAEFLGEMRDEVGRHALLSHMGWAVWAVAQSRVSGIEFDYLLYAALRMEGYWFFKRRHWPSPP